MAIRGVGHAVYGNAHPGKPPHHVVDLGGGRPELQAIPVGGWIEGAVVTVRSHELAVAALHGKGASRLSGGVGGTSTIDIPGDVQAVDWQTHPPYQLTVPLMFDGFATGDPVNGSINKLYRMARARRGDRRPPSVEIHGPVPLPAPSGIRWLVENIDQGDEVVRPDDGGPRLRQDLVLTLVQDRHPHLVVREEPPSHRHRRASYKKYRVKKSDLKGGLRGIAHRLKVKGGWKAIAKLNHIRDPKKIHAGQVLKIPT
jgi:hypothetical protein